MDTSVTFIRDLTFISVKKWPKIHCTLLCATLLIKSYLKATALEMIHDIREAFNDLLEENEWMDTETRHVAEDKANSMTERIGYPEYITNDTRLEEEYQNVSWEISDWPQSRFLDREISKISKLFQCALRN